MVRSVTQPLTGQLTREIDEILATVTGPSLSIEQRPGGIIQMDFAWLVRNIGDTDGQAGLRFNLQLDNFFGDVSQLIVEADGTIVGALTANVDEVSGNFPALVRAGFTTTLRLSVRVSASAMDERQGSVTGFNWWIGELIARDITNNQNAEGDSRFEIRDWFRITGAPSGPFALEVVGDPSFDVGQF